MNLSGELSGVFMRVDLIDGTSGDFPLEEVPFVGNWDGDRDSVVVCLWSDEEIGALIHDRTWMLDTPVTRVEDVRHQIDQQLNNQVSRCPWEYYKEEDHDRHRHEERPHGPARGDPHPARRGRAQGESRGGRTRLS